MRSTHPRDDHRETDRLTAYDGVNAAIERGGSRSWPSALLVAVVILGTLFLSDVASEDGGTALAAIAHETKALTHGLGAPYMSQKPALAVNPQSQNPQSPETTRG